VSRLRLGSRMSFSFLGTSDAGITRWQVPRKRKPKTPAALDAITDVVLAYRPNPKSKAAKKRKRKEKKLGQN
jgi:hypothetical protein